MTERSAKKNQKRSNVPFLSKAQSRWGHSPAGVKALGGKAKVKEWESATNYSKLPAKKMKKSYLKKKLGLRGKTKPGDMMDKMNSMKTATSSRGKVFGKKQGRKSIPAKKGGLKNFMG